MTRTGVSRWIGTAIVAVALFAGRPAQAGCDNPQCSPIGDGSGCCKSNCTWKDAGSACRGETDPCHAGTCNASHACVLSSPLVNADNGKKCFRPADPCQKGECSNGTCAQTSSDGWDEVCPEVDGNVCTRECQVTNNVPQCLTTGVAVPNVCFIISGNDCQPGNCSGGTCVANGPVTVCTDPPPVCHARSCTSTGQCSTVPTPGIQNCTKTGAQPGECELTQCSNAGNCVIVSKSAGIDCTETGLCRDANCDGNGNCDQTLQPVNTPCETDTNSCTNEVCSVSGSCVFGACAIQNICEFCAAGGIPDVQCQNSVPHDLNCGCANL